jgi:tRNA pseudouridine13 synthase
MTAAEYPSPLPAARRLDAEGIGGRIKERPEDFLVEELPLYEPTGAGEHLMLRVQKTGLAHGEMIRRIARHFGVREREIGCAGMKDRQAVTMQTITVHTPRTFGPDDVIDSRIAVHWAARHTSKIRRGHLAGNRFSIKIRGVDPLKAPSAARRLRELARRGAPNFVGPQRFGYRRNNHIIGILLLRKEWQAALDELLGAGGSRFPEHQRKRATCTMRGGSMKLFSIGAARIARSIPRCASSVAEAARSGHA